MDNPQFNKEAKNEFLSGADALLRAKARVVTYTVVTEESQTRNLSGRYSFQKFAKNLMYRR